LKGLGGYIASSARTHDQDTHPFDKFIETDSILNAWCPGCGIGAAVNAFFQAMIRAKIDPRDVLVFSGLGCTGRINAVLNLGGIQVLDRLSVERATFEKRAVPEKPVVVFVNDADLIAYGVDVLVETARAAPNIIVIYVNGLVYPMAQGMELVRARPAYKVYESRELPFNIPHLAVSCGARYVARWTSLHVRRMVFSISNALSKQRFSVIEVISPCLTYYAKYRRISSSLERAEYLVRAKVNNNEPLENLDLRRDTDIVVGVFEDSQ
jgi:2-oxoglutarate ferredoxin oxidoreductase subunit beta